MNQTKKKFIKDADNIVFDEKHRKTLNFNISKYDKSFFKALDRYSNLELAKQRASYIKGNAINHLYDYLIEFEKNISSHGVKVLWAEDGKEAIDYVGKILKEHKAKLVVKSKSMISEELEFNKDIEKMGVQSLETDLGEYIVQQAGEKPYHIVTPAMHKSKEDVAELFHKKFNLPLNSTPQDIAKYVRNYLRDKYIKADVGVTGANFLIADIGGIALTENEGNAMLTCSFPKVHIVIAGIEKVIPSVKDIGLLWPLLSAHGTGQKITVYDSIITGPKKENENDGPEEMYVILLDNKRTNLYKQEDQYVALKCIRCGACLNECPIYKNIGGYTYGVTYTGPIGSVISPFYNGFKDYHHLSYACSVCGRCTEVCPVKIPLHRLILDNRRDAVNKNYEPWIWNVGMKIFEKVFMHRKYLDIVNGTVKNLFSHRLHALGKKKSMPTFAKHSFSSQWKKKNK